MNRPILLLLSLFANLSACVKDRPNPDLHSLPSSKHRGIIISNEGSYGNNNGELSFLDIDSNAIFNQLYFTSNAKQLGDVVQSISRINNLYYVAVNNSNKIVVIDPTTYKEITTITSITSPRYITQVSANKAYVSCLYSPRIYVLDITSNKITSTIQVDFPNTERMICQNGLCYVTNWDTASNIIYQINTSNDRIEHRILINGRASHDIVSDKNGMLWILSGNKYKNKSSYLTQYNPLTKQIIQTFPFAAAHDPFRLTINQHKDTLYFINVDYNGTSSSNGLYRMSISNMTLPPSPFIQAPINSYFWALGIDSVTQHIYLSDPKGFTQQSTIYEYSSTGELMHQFTAGIGANSFLFNE
jgi:DNA-binding beta-propeller fold protein YncE